MSSKVNQNVYHVYLGKGGKFFDECLRNGILKLDYHNVPDGICSLGDWDAVWRHYTQDEKRSKAAATHHKWILKQYYESDQNDIWITHRGDSFWWCRADKEVTLNGDNTRYRKVIGGWNHTDNMGNPIFRTDIGNKSILDHRFRWTIHQYPDEEARFWIRKLL